MRHIFIVNPHSGPKDITETLRAQLNTLKTSDPMEVYITTAPGDATREVRRRCDEAQEELRFYACGGDGTLNEVVNGAVGCEHAVVASYPCGSGNDLVKYFGGKRFFLDLEAQLKGEVHPIDLIRVNDRYSINVVNLGFEAKAAARMVSFRRFPLLRGQRSYYAAVVATLIDGMKNRCKITADGNEVWNGPMLLSSAANGEYVGGSFRCAPRALVNDGLLHMLVVSPISILRFAKMIGMYQRGEHLDAPEMKDCMHYYRVRQIEYEAAKPFKICLDGEILQGSHFTVSVEPQALRFVVPAGAEHTGLGVDIEAEKA